MLPGQSNTQQVPIPVLPGVPIRMSMGSFGQFYLDGGLERMARSDENMGFVDLGKRKERDMVEETEIIVYQGRSKCLVCRKFDFPPHSI